MVLQFPVSWFVHWSAEWKAVLRLLQGILLHSNRKICAAIFGWRRSPRGRFGHHHRFGSVSGFESPLQSLQSNWGASTDLIGQPLVDRLLLGSLEFLWSCSVDLKRIFSRHSTAERYGTVVEEKYLQDNSTFGWSNSGFLQRRALDAFDLNSSCSLMFFFSSSSSSSSTCLCIQ